jgi:hypothetical protein
LLYAWRDADRQQGDMESPLKYFAELHDPRVGGPRRGKTTWLPGSVKSRIENAAFGSSQVYVSPAHSSLCPNHDIIVRLISTLPAVDVANPEMFIIFQN